MKHWICIIEFMTAFWNSSEIHETWLIFWIEGWKVIAFFRYEEMKNVVPHKSNDFGKHSKLILDFNIKSFPKLNNFHKGLRNICLVHFMGDYIRFCYSSDVICLKYFHVLIYWGSPSHHPDSIKYFKKIKFQFNRTDRVYS
jgi:hypothetical protein